MRGFFLRQWCPHQTLNNLKSRATVSALKLKAFRSALYKIFSPPESRVLSDMRDIRMTKRPKPYIW